jgi:hypothetical protein
MSQQTETDLVEHLTDHMGFLRASARIFDEGNQAEAKRLASTIRLLVHDTERSTSLLRQLSVKDVLLFLDTKEMDPPPPAPGTIVYRMEFGLAAAQLGPDGPKFVPRSFDDRNWPEYGPVPFQPWWERKVLSDLGGNGFTRKGLVLAMANKDGGVHVDPELEAAYAALTRSNSIGFYRDDSALYSPVFGGRTPVPQADEGQRPMPSPVPAQIRMIAFEVDRTLSTQLPDLLGWNVEPAARSA